MHNEVWGCAETCQSILRRAKTTDNRKWGNRRKSQEAKVKFKYNTRSPANTEKQVCPSISIKVRTFLISCKVMDFLSIRFLLCYYTVTLHFFFVKTQKIMSVSDIAIEAVVFIDLVINIHREFVHSLVNFT